MRYEVSNQLRYAWVIRTRPDLAFFDRVPSCITMSTRRLVCMEKESNPSYFDGFWMVRVRAAEPSLIPHPQIYAHLAASDHMRISHPHFELIPNIPRAFNLPHIPRIFDFLTLS